MSLLRVDPPVRLPPKEDRPIEGFGQRAARPSDDMRSFLSAILPHRECPGEGDGVVRVVSDAPPTREDVAALEESLDRLLLERRARPSPLCPVREELFSEAFDEILRQVTLECPERGLLLLRVRDELRMTLAAYNTIASYQASKPPPDSSLLALEATLEECEKNKAALLGSLQELTALSNAIGIRLTSTDARVDREREEELRRLVDQNAMLQAFIDDAAGARKSTTEVSSPRA